MSRLVICSGCDRHVRDTESRCPFCDAVVVAQVAEPPPVPHRLGRAARMAFGAVVASAAVATSVSVSACGSGGGGELAEAGSDAQTTGETGGGDGATDSGGQTDTSIPDVVVPNDAPVAHPYGSPPANGLIGWV